MKKLQLLMLGLIVGISSSCPAFAENADNTLHEFTLDPINITALGYEKSALDTPSDISVYKGADLKRTGASDVANALKYKEGIIFSQMGPHDQSWITGNSTVSLRGIKGGTLVLVNGVPATFNNVSHLDMMNLDTVDRVEIVKGGGAVLYGSEAYGGVINVITKNKYDNHVRVAVGNKGQREYQATLGLGKLGISLGRNEMGETGIISEAAGTKTVSGTKVPYYFDFGKSRKDHIGMTYQFNDKLSMSYLFNKKKYSIDYVDSNDTKLQHFNYDDREHFAQIHFDDKNGLQATGYYNYRSIRNPDYWMKYPDKLEWERSNHKNYGVDVKKVWDKGNEKFLLGLNVKREIYSDENQKFASFGNSESALKPSVRFGSYSLNEYSLYGQYDRKLSNATNLVFSLREDIVRSDATDTEAFLPQLQINTKLNDSSSVYANIGRSFRMPTFRQLYYSSGALLANPDLKPEYGWNYELGYKHTGKNDQFKAALFKIDLKDQITSRRVNGMSQSYNAARYRNVGLELSYTRNVNDNLDFTVGGIYSKPENKATESAEWKRVLGRYQLMGSVNWHNKKAEASLNLSYMGKRVHNSSQNEVKPLLISNFHAGYEIFENASLTLDINNIFNRKDLSDPDGYYYTLGRTFLVGLNYKF